MATTLTPAQQAEQDRQAAARAHRLEATDTAEGNAAGARHAAAVNQADLAKANAIATQQTQQTQATAAASTAATTASTVQSATAMVNQYLASNIPGLSTLDPNGLFSGWLSGQLSALAQQGMQSSDISSTIQAQLNSPIGTSVQGVMDQIFPGYTARIQNGSGNGGGLGAYVSYAQQAIAFQNTLGLPQGTITGQDIGALWSGDVSSAEVSQRLTDAYTAAQNVPQQVKDYLGQNYGLSGSALTAYFINPANTMNVINQTMNSAYVGGEAQLTGFGSLSTAQSNALGAFLANGNANGSSTSAGYVNPISAAQANQFFTSNMSSSTGGQVTGSLNQLANYQKTAAGQSTTGTVSADTLIQAAEGNAAAIAQTANAQQARTAGAKGGGGATTTSEGAVGLGFAQS